MLVDAPVISDTRSVLFTAAVLRGLVADMDGDDEVTTSKGVSLEVKVPDWVPGLNARFTAHYESERTGRRQGFFRAVLNAWGQSTEELGRTLSSDSSEVARMLLDQGRDRAEDVRDPIYIDALGRLVTAALDKAKVEESTFIMATLLSLEPPHLRCLLACYHFYAAAEPGSEAYLPAESPASAELFAESTALGHELARDLGVSVAAADNMLHRLGREDLARVSARALHEERLDDGSFPLERGATPTAWATQVMRHLFPHLKLVDEAAPQ